jgi:hypothetical protein
MFRQECNSLPLLHKAVLHCKIFPACNHFLTEQFCITKSLLLSCFSVPFEAIKPYISFQASARLVFLTEGQKKKILLPTTYTTEKSLLWCQTNTLKVAEMQCRSIQFCVHSNKIAMWEKCDAGLRMKQGKSLYEKDIFLCLKINIWSAPAIHKLHVHVLPLEVFKCPTHKIMHFSNFNHTFHCTFFSC